VAAVEAIRILQDLAAILGTAIVMGFLFHRLRQPPVIGYLIGGLIIGPHGLALVPDSEAVGMFAEIGVIMLMFALGVEFSLAEIAPVWRVALLGTGAQIALTCMVVTGAGRFFGLSLGTGLLLGFVVALSSTMIALKVLMERGELDTLHGRVSIGILIAQDLAVVPMMLAFPNLGDQSHLLGWPMLVGLGEAVVLLGGMWYLGNSLVPLVMRRVAATGSRELLFLSAMALAFGTAAIAYLLGLSLAVGAFLAGIVASESDQSHQILAEMRPIRDLFSTLFFVAVGMLIDLDFVWQNLGVVLAATAGLILGKALLISGLCRAFGYAGRTSLAVGLGLSQIGEFSFVLARMGTDAGLLTSNQFSLILGTALLSIVATPLLMVSYVPLYGALRRAFPALSRPLPAGGRQPHATGALAGLVDHVVICGFGRVGRNVCEVLVRHNIPAVVVDIDHTVLLEARSRGLATVYGDAANLEVMRQVSLPLAKLLVIALPDPIGTRLALHHSRQINPRLLVLCRAHRTQDIEALYDAGADQVIQPEFEASVEAIRYTLTALGYTRHQIDLYTTEIREAHYRQFLDDFKPQEVATIWEALGKQDLEWLVVNPRSEIAGLSLADSAIRTRTGAAILAIRRDGSTIANPEPDTSIEGGDALLVMGQEDQIRMLEALVNPPIKVRTGGLE